MGLVDGSYPPPTTTIQATTGKTQVNPSFQDWLRLDQSVRSWLCATLSPKVLIDVWDCPRSNQVWCNLQHRFQHSGMVRALELKRVLANTKKGDNQPIDVYLCEIKDVADGLASTNSQVPPADLIY